MLFHKNTTHGITDYSHFLPSAEEIEVKLHPKAQRDKKQQRGDHRGPDSDLITVMTLHFLQLFSFPRQGCPRILSAR